MAESHFAKLGVTNYFGTNFVPNNFHILIVDRDLRSLHYMSSMLQKASFNVTISSGAFEALTLIKQKNINFQLILADMATILELNEDHYLFMQEINTETHVILMSDDKKNYSLDKGFLIKPVNFEKLMTCIKEKLRNSTIFPMQLGLQKNHSQALDHCRSNGIRIEEDVSRARIQTLTINGKEFIIVDDHEEEYSSHYNTNNTLISCNDLLSTNCPNYSGTSSEMKGKDVIIIDDDDDDDDSEINKGKGLMIANGTGKEDGDLTKREGMKLKRKVTDVREEHQDKRFKLTSSGSLFIEPLLPFENRYDHINYERTTQEANIPDLPPRSNEKYDKRYIAEMLKDSPLILSQVVSFSGLKPYLRQNPIFRQSGFGIDQTNLKSESNNWNMSLLQNPNDDTLSSENDYGVVLGQQLTLLIGQDQSTYIIVENANKNSYSYYCTEPKFFDLNCFAFKRTLEDSYNYAEWLKINPKGKSTNAEEVSEDRSSKPVFG